MSFDEVSEVTPLVVDNGSDMCKAGFAGKAIHSSNKA